MVRVLVVDDEVELLEEIVETLQFEGFEVSYAETGLSGLQAARDEQPDVIVCDVMMPDLNGYEVLSELRSDSQTMAIPFIFLTARVSDIDRRTGMNLGADDYLTKPFAAVDLINTINIRLEKKRAYDIYRLRDFSQRLIQFQENERRNLAQMLRDRLTNQLNSLKILLDVMKQLPGQEQTTILNNAGQIVLEMLDEIQDISRTLWPTLLHHLGLLPALLSHFIYFKNQTGIEVDFKHKGLESITDSGVKIAVFRIVQEALSNVAKHARVDSVFLRTWIEEGRLHMHIIDNGIGFDIDNVLYSTAYSGLIGIQERVYSLGGQITLLSSGGNGTQILCHLPLDVSNATNSATSILKTQSLATGQNDGLSPLASSDRPSKQSIGIVIIDKDDMLRWGLRSIIENTSRYTVIGEAPSLQDGITIIEGLSPDIIMIGMTLGSTEGAFVPLNQIADVSPQSRIIILSQYTEHTFAYSAIQNGAAGYVLKSRISEELPSALDTVISERQYITEYIDLADTNRSNTSDEEHPLDTFTALTRREREIFYMVLNGMTNKEIAVDLVISPRTAETHRLNMMRKLGLTGHTELMRYALEKNLWHP